MAKSVEQKLYEAYRNGKGVTLSAADVASLVEDDAVGTRITNSAAHDAGVDQPGCDCICGVRPRLTWKQFQKSLRAEE